MQKFNSQIVFVLLTSMFLFTVACRKKIEREYEVVDPVTAHCQNGVMDQDEKGLDCGGSDCEPCSQYEADCTLPDDKVKMYYTSGIAETIDIVSTSIDSVSSSKWVFTATIDDSGLEYFEITFPSKPSVTTAYKFVSDPSYPESNEVHLVFEGYYTTNRYSNNDFVLNYEDGHYIITSCDAGFHTWSGDPFDNQWLSISF